MLALCLLLAAGDPGFGGVPADDADVSAADVDDAVNDHEFPGGAPPTTTTPQTSAPTLVWKPTPTTTPLEQELQAAGLDPGRYPLLQLRVDVARLERDLKDLEGRGLTAARDIEPKLEAARLLLDDAEAVALGRMQKCMQRQGVKSQVKNYRMTPGGPVLLTTQEILAQTNRVDPAGCARIDLIDQPLVDRLKRAHELQHRLETEDFPYHRVAERKALEDELQALLQGLQGEGVLAVRRDRRR